MRTLKSLRLSKLRCTMFCRLYFVHLELRVYICMMRFELIKQIVNDVIIDPHCVLRTSVYLLPVLENCAQWKIVYVCFFFYCINVLATFFFFLSQRHFFTRTINLSEVFKPLNKIKCHYERWQMHCVAAFG